MTEALVAWAQGTSRMKSDALRTMESCLSSMAGHDPVVASEARTYVEHFRNQFPWATYGEPNDPRRIRGPVLGGGQAMGHFVVLPHDPKPQAGQEKYGSWYPTLRELVVFRTFDPTCRISASVLWHELYHAHDPRVQDPVNWAPFSDGRFPIESDAWAFQSSVLDAMVGGRYREQISHLADLARRRKTRSVHKGKFCLPALSPSFLRLFAARRPSPKSVNTLILQVMYDIAYELAGRHRSSEQARHDRERLYTDFMTEALTPLGPKDKAFVRAFVDRW